MDVIKKFLFYFICKVWRKNITFSDEKKMLWGSRSDPYYTKNEKPLMKLFAPLKKNQSTGACII